MVTSFGSSTGVRNRTMPAAPAMPNARASELPMMIIITAPDTHSSSCACSSDFGRSRLTGWWIEVTSAPISAAATIFESSMNGCSRGTGLRAMFWPFSSMCCVTVSIPASCSGHFIPIQTSAEQSTAPPARMRTLAPRPRRPARGRHRIKGHEDRRQPRGLEDLGDDRPHRREAEASAKPLCRRVAADERADAAAVDHRHAGQIEDQMALAAAEQLLDVALEGLGRASSDEGHLRREDEAVSGRTSGVWHGCYENGVAANYTPARV